MTRLLFTSHRGQHLEDRDGAVGLHDDTGGWQEWELQDAGNGKFFIVSHRGQQLEDRRGRVKVHRDRGGWQEWLISTADGIPPCLSAPSGAAPLGPWEKIAGPKKKCKKWEEKINRLTYEECQAHAVAEGKTTITWNEKNGKCRICKNEDVKRAGSKRNSVYQMQGTPPEWPAPVLVEGDFGDWGEISCSDGMHVIAGGCDAKQHPYLMQASRPNDAGTGWICGGHGGPKHIWALCSSLPVETVRVDGGDWNEVSCPTGMKAVGGGCDARGHPYRMEFNGVANDELTGYKCGGSGAPKTTWAICTADDGHYVRRTADAGDWHTEACPDGSTLVSGGCQAHHGPHVYQYNGPNGNGWQCGGHGGGKKVWAI